MFTHSNLLHQLSLYDNLDNLIELVLVLVVKLQLVPRDLLVSLCGE